MQPVLSHMSALAGVVIIGIVFCRVLGDDPPVTCTVRSEKDTAYLTCTIPSSMDIVQVTWQKKKGNSYETLVTHSKRFGTKISKPYENRISVLEAKDPGTSSIALSQLEKEDSACFLAIYNIYPDGALKGEVCLQKVRGLNEVVCKSSADFSVTLDPPEINTQHSEPDGTVMQIGRWINDGISPVCNFHLRRTARYKRSVKDGDEIFSIECSTSGPQTPNITWNNEGRPISKEEKVNRTGDLFVVTSTLHHSLSTLPEESEISCKIAYDKGANSSRHEVTYQDTKIEKSYVVRILIVSSAILVILATGLLSIVYYIIKRNNATFSKTVDKIEDGVLTPLTKSTPKSYGTPGSTKKTQKVSAMEQNKENIQPRSADSSHSPIGTEETNVSTPGTEIKQRNGSTVKKNKENASIVTDKVSGKTPRSEKKPINGSQQKTKPKPGKKLQF